MGKSHGPVQKKRTVAKRGNSAKSKGKVFGNWQKKGKKK